MPGLVACIRPVAVPLLAVLAVALLLPSRVSATEPSPATMRHIMDLKIELAQKLAEKINLENEKAFLEQTMNGKQLEQNSFENALRSEAVEAEKIKAELQEFQEKTLNPQEKAFEDESTAETKIAEAIKSAKAQRDALIAQQEELVHKLADYGMGHYVDHHSKHLSPMFRNILLKSYEAVTPFFDTIAHAAETNDRLVEHVTREIDKHAHVHVRESPFINGLIHYFVLLIPILTVVMLGLQIFQNAAKMTVSHYILFGNFYLFLLCLACGVASAVFSVDPMMGLANSHPALYLSFLLFCALFFMWHVVLLTLQCAVSSDPTNISQWTAWCVVGFHYFVFVWKRAFSDEPPQMQASAYLIYATIFGFITFDRAERTEVTWIIDNPLVDYTMQLDKSVNVDFSTLVSNLAHTVSEFVQSLIEKLRPRKKKGGRKGRYVESEDDLSAEDAYYSQKKSKSAAPGGFLGHMFGGTSGKGKRTRR